MFKLGKRAKRSPASFRSAGRCRNLNCDRFRFRFDKFLVTEIVLLEKDGSPGDRFLPPFDAAAERAARGALVAGNPEITAGGLCRDKGCVCLLGRETIMVQRRNPGYVAQFRVPGLGAMARAVGSARLTIFYRQGSCVR